MKKLFQTIATLFTVLCLSLGMTSLVHAAPQRCVDIKGKAVSEDQCSIDTGSEFFSTKSAGKCSVASGITAVSTVMPATIPEPHRSLFAQAGSAFNINPQYLAAIFLTENGNVWKPFDTAWPTSKPGAMGPMQFMPGTWSAYQTDGDRDGHADINNITDAVYSAANMASKNGINATSPLGDLDKPFTPGTFILFTIVYNWGGGNVQRKSTADSPLTVASAEAQNYAKNIYALVSSGFTTTGNGGPIAPGGASSGGVISTSVISPGGCGAGAVIAGNVIQTAIALAWDTTGHGKNKEDARQVYQDAMDKYNASPDTDPYSDCGIFVATVMIATGTDTGYPKINTFDQIDYLRTHPQKYQIYEDINDTSQLVPGDILIYSDPPEGHTYIYVGPQSNGFNSVSASHHDHVPEASNAYFSSGSHHFTVARLK